MAFLLMMIGIVFTAVSGFVNMIITLYAGYFGLVISAGVNVLFASFMEKLREDMEEKGVAAKKFFIFAEGVPLVFSGFAFALVIYLDSINYWSGLFAGMFEVILSFSSFAGIIMIAVFHMIILEIKHIKKRKI